MKQLAASILASALLLGACHAATPKVAASEFYGTWKVSGIAAVGDGSDSEAQMNALIGTTVMVSAQRIEEGGDTCELSTHAVRISVVDTSQDADIRLGRVAPGAIGLPKYAPKMDAGCMILFKSGDKLIFADRGAYYTAMRIH